MDVHWRHNFVICLYALKDRKKVNLIVFAGKSWDVCLHKMPASFLYYPNWWISTSLNYMAYNSSGSLRYLNGVICLELIWFGISVMSIRLFSSFWIPYDLVIGRFKCLYCPFRVLQCPAVGRTNTARLQLLNFGHIRIKSEKIACLKNQDIKDYNSVFFFIERNSTSKLNSSTTVFFLNWIPGM